ncbi:MAG TPA: ABC transporter substrate-binding protein [bacterium]|nr:ABC transporter substrate-binding protein [bacterium]
MNRWALRPTVALLVACVVALTLFTVPRGGHAAAPTTLTIAVGIDADTLDPAGQTTTTISNIVDYMFDSLLWPADERSGAQPGQAQYTKLAPQLATSWTVSPDGLTYTFKLRQGVKFQDGTDFNAEAVKFNIQRVLDPAVRNPNRYYFTDIDATRIDTPDPYTVVLHLKKTSPTLLGRLAAGPGEMLSPTAVKKLGNDKIPLGPAEAGSGPYMFKEWVHGDHITLVKNPNYWGKKPYFDTVIFRVVPNAGTRETMLRAGDVQMAFEPPAPDIPALRKDTSLTVVSGPSDRAVFIGLNNQWGAFKDPRVRQAMNFAINKDAIIHSVLFGLAHVLESPTTPALFGYTRLQPGGWPFNPVQAKKLLSEAGFPQGFAVDFRTPTGRYIQDYQFAQAVAAQLSNVGIHANISTSDWPTYVHWMTTPLAQTPLQMFVLGWATQYLDADGALFGQFYSAQWPPAGLAPMFYKDAQVDKLLQDGQTVPDPAKRQAIYKDAQEMIWKDAPWIFLWSQDFYMVTSSHLEGVAVTPNEKWAAIYATWK